MGLFSSIGKALGRSIGGLTGADEQSRAIQRASETQANSAQSGIDEQRRQFDALKALLEPFVTAGNQSLGGQKDLIGLNGASAQGAAIDGIEQSPQMQALLARGENSILQNASATGGLRGGNTQAALAQFSPSLLSQLIDQQYSRLGGLTSLGQSSAAMTGSAGLQTGGAIANLLQQQGAATAGGQIAAGSVTRQAFNDMLSLLSAGAGATGGGGASGGGAKASLF